MKDPLIFKSTPPAPFSMKQLIKAGGEVIIYSFSSPDGKESYTVNFSGDDNNKKKGDQFDVYFYNNKKKFSTNLTGTGHQRLVMETVLAIMRDFFKRRTENRKKTRPPFELVFFAKNEEKKRKTGRVSFFNRVYERLEKINVPDYDGWVLEKKERENGVEYRVIQKME